MQADGWCVRVLSAQRSGEQLPSTLGSGRLTRNPTNVSALLSLMLMPPTPALARWHVFTSKNQIVPLSVMGTTRFVIAVPCTVSRKPESKPLAVDRDIRVVYGDAGRRERALRHGVVYLCDWYREGLLVDVRMFARGGRDGREGE